MTRLPRAIVAVLPAAALLSACAAGPTATPSPNDEPRPTPSLSASSPAASDDLPHAGDDVTAWAQIALPENRPGGGGFLSRSAGAVGPEGVAIALPTDAGLWEIVITCQSEDGSPLVLQLESAVTTPEATATELECSAPGEPQPATAAILFEGDADGSIRVDATADAVYAYEIRPHVDPGS